MAERATKQQRISEAREAAKRAREERERRAKRRRILIPTGVSVAVIAIVVIVVVIIATTPKAAAPAANGPANMVSDGIVFSATNGAATVVPTAALKKGEVPTATTWPASDTRLHLVSYIDWTCPGCQQFEEAYASNIASLVAANKITLEVHPVAILDSHYTTNYSTRAANAAACIAQYQPDQFLKAQAAMYTNQAAEGSAGLTDSKIISIVHGAGVTDARVDSCINQLTFQNWVAAETDRATSDSTLVDPSIGTFSTPTFTVNGKRTSSADVITALQKVS